VAQNRATSKKAGKRGQETTRFYVTTPIYYVNDEPHIGHAYTTVLADVLARFHRLAGEEVFFLTGTDEHGQKVARAASARGVSPQAHVDEMVVRFQELWRLLNISNDDFIRTTEPRHIRVVQGMLQQLYDAGDIYQDMYEGWYCVPDERFWTEKDLVEGKCPDCGRAVERVQETNYFFRMSKYQGWLIDHIRSHPEFIQPESRRNEVLGFLAKPLGDLCISRPKARLSWGIPLPFDEDYVTYVWFDALVNYISVPGYLSDAERFSRWWPGIHLVGKDILITHSVYWPTMLRAAGVEPPKAIYAHGWWLIGSAKMSKSRGQVVRPLDMAWKYGVDAFRYYLIREMVFGMDADFSEEGLVMRLNADLANDLGNLLNRVINMMGRYCAGRVPTPATELPIDADLRRAAEELPNEVLRLVYDMQLHAAVERVILMVRQINKYLEMNEPWKLSRQGSTDEEKRKNMERVGTVLYYAAEALRIAALMLWPVMPEKMSSLEEALGRYETDSHSRRVGKRLLAEEGAWGLLQPGTKVKLESPLFPRVELSG